MSQESYQINLTETDLNTLFEGYMDVEGTIEKVIDQAKDQGYEPPLQIYKED